MHNLNVKLEINEKLYLKDPSLSTLGRKIIEHSVSLIYELGLEQFTFKKLATLIGCTEASVYRYFENKHQLFVYLLNWYWELMFINIELNTLNIRDASEKLKIIISVIIDSAQRNTANTLLDEDLLHSIVIREGSKGYHHKGVDSDNEDGFFLSYKRLCGHIAEVICEVNVDFSYPLALASTLIETANNNIYFANHLPRLTDIRGETSTFRGQTQEMLEFFAFGLINKTVID